MCIDRSRMCVCTVDYIWWKSQRVCVTGGLIENGKYLIVTMCVGVSLCMLVCECAILFGKPPSWSERAPHFSPFAACFSRWICTETSRFSFIKSNDISGTFTSPWNISKVHLQLSGVWLSITEWERRATTWFQAAGFKVCLHTVWGGTILLKWLRWASVISCNPCQNS